jgi:hypothetical protein
MAGLPAPGVARRLTVLTYLAAVLISLGVTLRTQRLALQELAWADEFIYLVGARNIVERGTLDTNFYVTYSILRKGHPHRDVHMPGYILVLSPFVAAFGATLKAGVLLNALLFVVCAVLVASLARALLPDPRQALVTAVLFPLLPPFPGYIQVVWAEMAITCVFLLGIWWLLRSRSVAGAAVAGVLFGSGALFRETLLLAAPIYVARLERRHLWRGFVPAAVVTLGVVFALFGGGRAVHPNALFPSALEEAWASETPARTFTALILKNLATNVKLTLASQPLETAEDAVLAFLLLLALLAALGSRRLSGPARSFANGTLASLGLLTIAVFVLYVVRQRGGVWGGVRAYMTFAPLMLILSVPLFSFRRAIVAALSAGALATGLVALDLWQVRFFNRYKGSDLEDQIRNDEYVSRWIDAYRPRRIVSRRSFRYGYTHYPVDVVWQPPDDGRELAALNQALSYEFLVIHERSVLRHVLMRNPRYLRLNKEDRGAEFLIWRRLY